MKMKGIEGAPVNWLVMALSQSMEPWKPSKCWASLLCFSWRAWFISLSSSSTHTSKLINSCLLFSPLAYVGGRIKLSHSFVMDVSLLGTLAHKELWPYLIYWGLWLLLALNLIVPCVVPPCGCVMVQTAKHCLRAQSAKLTPNTRAWKKIICRNKILQHVVMTEIQLFTEQDLEFGIWLAFTFNHKTF